MRSLKDNNNNLFIFLYVDETVDRPLIINDINDINDCNGHTGETMQDTKLLYDLIIDVWRLVRENPNPVTEAEWEKLLEEGKVIDNNPKYADVEPLARHWINNYVFWLEGKLT